MKTEAQLAEEQRAELVLEMDYERRQANKLRKAYQKDPELWRSKNLARRTARECIEQFTSHADTVETLIANYDGKVRELTREQDTALERSLVEVVALSWLRLQFVEAEDAALERLTLTKDGLTEKAEEMDRRLTSAQHRFLKAAESLARVRRLALPILLLNVAGKQQVNIGKVESLRKASQTVSPGEDVQGVT